MFANVLLVCGKMGKRLEDMGGRVFCKAFSSPSKGIAILSETVSSTFF